MAVVILPWLAAVMPVINEVCYDPEGADTGREYVELHHAGPDSFDLAGARIEFANGSEDPPRWRSQWEGRPGDRVGPGAVFLIVDAGWSGPSPGDAQGDLNLQNGPDAVRLVRPDGSVDLLGYGDLTAPELYETRSAPVAGAGKVLARRPDGADSDDNAADFAVADPTPGRANFPLVDLEIRSIDLDPPSLPRPGDATTVAVRIANRGLQAVDACPLRLTAGVTTVGGEFPSLPVGADTVWAARLDLAAPGRHGLVLEIFTGAAAQPWRASLGSLQVGPAWVALNEVMAAPAGGGEWIELVNLDSTPRSLGTLAVRDEDGAWRSLPEVTLAPGSLAVLAQDPAGFAAWWSGEPPADVLQLAGSWPSLNDTPPSSRDFADRVWLADADGTVVDHVTLAAGAAPGRRSWERIAPTWIGPLAAGWRPSTAPLGATPGGPNSVARADGADGDFTARPNPFSRAEGDGATHLAFVIGGTGCGWRLRIYDLWGRLVRDLGGDDLGPGVRELVWDGSDDEGGALPAGGYVAALRIVGAGGDASGGGRRLLVIQEAPW